MIRPATELSSVLKLDPKEGTICPFRRKADEELLIKLSFGELFLFA